jgi:uncharacterized protein (TIGR00730 family)
MKICIYCASSKLIPSIYFEQTEVLTQNLVKANHHIVYGGGSQGLMGQVADTCLEMGGQITGVIPGFMKEVEWDHKEVNDMRIVKDMAERKQQFFDLSEVIIALPGGVGTLEELGEALSLKRLSIIRHPIIIANFGGYYDEFLVYLHKMVDEQFMGEQARKLWTEIKTPEKIIGVINNSEPWPDGMPKTESF